jgi:hypothetical protein
MPYDYITKVCPICGAAYQTVAGESMPFCLRCLNEGNSLRVKAFMARRQLVVHSIAQIARGVHRTINLFERR